MENQQNNPANYWNILAAAEAALDQGDFSTAEHYFHEAASRRAGSPGRVFFSEKMTDGLKGLFRQAAQREDRKMTAPGRWSQRTADFRNRFLRLGEPVVREGIRVAELRPEDDPAANQPVLESSLFLVARSRIFAQEPSSAVPLLKGLFRTACRTGRTFEFDLVRHDLPLTEEDRLHLARQGGDLCDVFREQGSLVAGTDGADKWAQALLALLQPRYFGSTGRLEEERSWLEAVTADRLQDKAGASVELYRAYLGVAPVIGPRVDEARVRLTELLGNTDAGHFPVARYEEALAALEPDDLMEAGPLKDRLEMARARILYRRPEPTGTAGASLAWASVAAADDGLVTIVYWSDNEPRDVASWRPGQDAGTLEEFLAPCADRLVAFDDTVQSLVHPLWKEAPAPWTVRDFMLALMESFLPRTGLERDTVLGWCLAETGPWRAGWNPSAGHPDLEPPRSSSLLEAWEEGPVAGALMAGLAWLAVRNRVASGDPTLRAGLGELARRGDPASRFLYAFINMDSHGGPGLDASFRPWTLPLLWTRPDPFGWSVGGGPRHREQPSAAGPGVRPDLGRNDLAVVTTGDPSAVLAAWGDGRQKLRVVLDRPERLESLAGISGGVIGPVTMIPPSGTVHSLPAALDFLEALLTDVRPDQEALLPIFHWLRLVETHNGDLLDFRQVRPRPAGRFPLYDRYATAVAALDREEPRLDPEGHLDTWAGQFSQRVRKAGLVAGPVEYLAVTSDRLDSLWGVFEGSDASWVFLDSAAIHWALLRGGPLGVEEIHALLHSRGARHLSLLTGPAWLRPELESLLGSWLGVFGSPYYLSLTDVRPPTLLLADRGIQPEARIQAAEALASQATWIEGALAKAADGFIQLPADGRSAAFWGSVSSGEISLSRRDWKFLPPVGSDPGPVAGSGLLAVPSLASLEIATMPVARSDSRADWARADAERNVFFAWRRKICALEMAALMAGPWDTVAILDTRWWRLLPSGPGSGTDTGGTATAGSSEVVRRATEGVGRALSLPGSGPRGGQAVDGGILAVVNGWLMTHDPDAEQLPAGPGAAAVQASALPAKGVNILLGDIAPTWERLTVQVAEAWEGGRVESWILLVADAVPEGAADLVAAAGMAGISVWSADAGNFDPAPVVWVEPEDFSDPGLAQFLAVHAPTAIVAGDVADWKPGADRQAQETALAVRSILDCRADTVLLHSQNPADSWIRFLARACGARLIGGTGSVPAAALDAPAPSAEQVCLDCGRAVNATTVVGRLQALLFRLRTLVVSRPGGPDESEGEKPPGRQLLPLAWLGDLAGLSPVDVAEGAVMLRWAARLAGDSLSAAGSLAQQAGRSGGGHTLLIPLRFADIENDLEKMQENLRVMLPLWLGHSRPGLLNWIDLDHPPARIDTGELTLLDGYLVCHGSLFPDTGLTYCCPRGLIHSSERLVGCRRTPAEVMEELVARLGQFRSRIFDLMAGALETGEGFLVETGLTDLRDEESFFLGLGVALGFWRWIGPPCEGAIHLVDLLTVAESRTVKQASAGWELVRDEAALRYPGTGDLVPAGQGRNMPPAESGRGLRGLRSLLAGGAEKRDDLDPVVTRVTEAVRGKGEGSFLVLRGVCGSGRHEALGRGLLQAGQGSGEVPELTIYCPDEAVAAMACREFLRLGLSGPLDVRVPSGDATVPEPAEGGAKRADPSMAVVVMCEAQRFDPDTRYRIAQTGRRRRLIMTVDPVATAEPWEHLFLTTPRSDDIVDLPGQRRAARKLWSEVGRLVPQEYRQTGHQRRDKGVLISDYAANLDQCLSRVTLEHQSGKLMEPLRVTAPMPGDLEYLGSSIRDRGWLAVLETRLESLLLPGPREFLAAATDHLVLGGHLDPVPPGGAEDEAASSAPVPEGRPDLMTPRLLGPEGAAAWTSWIETQDPAADPTLNDFAEQVAPTAWGITFLARPDNRVRVMRFLEQYGNEPLSALMTLPLWEAWWYGMMDDLALKGPRHRRPLAVLTSATRPLGSSLPGAAYLCLGTEPESQHYESLVRVTDSLLILYQEKSPLPSESSE